VLAGLPLMSQLRRLKNQFGNQQLDQLRTQGEEFRKQLQKVRETYREQSQ